ncbi:MAG: EAL domain-containing protein, partial [Mycobacterium sp.]|nr:EAL domain-containing protein [Mycobacterium sp.]
VDAHTDRVVEEELLVRVVGRDGRVMVPDDFLPQARRFGLMPTIDRFMVARGIELARAGRRVAVNLSAHSINDGATVSTIVEQLRAAGDAAARVSFEITEHTALASTDLAERFSADMRRLGCRLALDDFGTGFGSFTELRGMMLDKLKIDRSFVSGLLRNPQDESVVRAIIAIAGEFALLTTAEGVEDVETRNRLVELGVDQLQGFLVGRPAPATRADERRQ